MKDRLDQTLKKFSSQCDYLEVHLEEIHESRIQFTGPQFNLIGLSSVDPGLAVILIPLPRPIGQFAGLTREFIIMGIAQQSVVFRRLNIDIRFGIDEYPHGYLYGQVFKLTSLHKVIEKLRMRFQATMSDRFNQVLQNQPPRV